MVSLLFNGNSINYTGLVIRDLGCDISCNFFPTMSTNLSKGSLIIVGDKLAKYDFMVYKVIGNAVYSRLAITERLKTKKIKVDVKARTPFAFVISSIGIPFLRTSYDFTVGNINFLGTAFDFLLFLSTQYDLNYYLLNNLVIIYKNLAELRTYGHVEKIIGEQNSIANLIRTYSHAEKVLNGNSVLINLKIRCLDTVNNKRIKELVHLPISNLTIFSYLTKE